MLPNTLQVIENQLISFLSAHNYWLELRKEFRYELEAINKTS